MTLVASILAPAAASVALGLEPPQPHWSASVDLDIVSAPAVAQRSFAATARDGGPSLLPSAPVHNLPRSDEVALFDALRVALAFAGLAVIGAVRNPHQ